MRVVVEDAWPVLPSWRIANALACVDDLELAGLQRTGITVVVGSAFAPTSQPKRSQKPQ